MNLTTRALVLRPILREKTRTAITILGIAVGVAVIVAIQLSNQSALRAFRESVDAIAGRANYQIVSGGAPLDENVLLSLQPLWNDGVRFAPVVDVEGVVEPSGLPIRLLGVDLLSDLHFRDYRYASVTTGSSSNALGEGTSARRKQSRESVAQSYAGSTSATQIATYFDLFRPDSVIVPASFAREQHLALGSPLTIEIRGQRRAMIVRGILEPKGPATAFNGSLAVADIATAQKAFGLTGRLSRVDLIVPEAREKALLAKIEKLLPAGVRIERPSRRNDRVEKMLRAFRVNLFALAGVALLVGMFLVYNTVLISILRRRKDVGVLKTLGVAPRQIFFAFLGEGLLFGLVGSALGVALGDALAYGILGLIGRTINSLYVSSAPQSIELTAGVVASGMLIGTLLSLISAAQPSIEAAQQPPSALIRPGLQQRVSRRYGRALAIAAVMLFAIAILLSRLPSWRGLAIAGYAAVLFVVAGFSLLAPAIVAGTSLLTAPLLRRLFGLVGQLAAASLPASLRRTAVASAALSLATGMMVAVALMVGSFRQTVNVWINQTISSDLWLRPAKGLTAVAAAFPPSIGDELRLVPFIAAIDRTRGHGAVYRDSNILVASGDFAVAARLGTLPMITPASSATAIAEALRRNGVMASESFNIKFGKGVGDVVELPTANGLGRFPITGIYRDYSNDRGVLVMDRALFIRSFRDDAIDTVVVFLKKGVDLGFARRELERRFGPKYHAFAITNGEIRGEVMKIFDQTFMITYALLAVAIIVAVLGIVNTLAALILERARELALLRVSGMTTAEVRVMIVLESSLLGLASTVVGLVMGYALSWILIYVINKQSFGWTIEFHTPVRLIVASLAVTFFSAVLAGILPSRLANRLDLATATKSE